MENKFWKFEGNAEIKTLTGEETELLDTMETITVSQHMKNDEHWREKFPYELPQDVYHAMSGRVTLYKTPQTREDWHKHYMKKAEIASDVAEEYHEKAHYYKKQAKKALKR